MEEEQELKIPETIIYDTIGPLALSAVDDSPLSDHLEPIAVFRNEISLETPQRASPASAAVDFFSLDVAADASARDPFPELLAAAPEPMTPAPAPEPKLESGWFHGNCKFKSPMLQLHKEIVDFCAFLSPTAEEKAARDLAIESVFGVVKHIWPHCQVEVFGSFRTGLYLPTSDVDVVILKSGLQNPQIGLNAISKALSQRGMAKKIQVIGKARVPIIKFVEKRSGIAFDISFDIDNGPKAAEYIQEAVVKWPPLRPLCLILKVFLQQRELNEVYSGGIGSYALLTMLMAMLRVRSAFSMALKNLTDAKIITSLGPNRSILGTIIRPDPVLLERKGGLNGDVTFDKLLPGAGEPLQQQYGDEDMLCNWQLDYEEEPLPRGVNTSAEPSTRSSTKKRKSSSKKSSKKLKENGDLQMVRNEENDSRKENSKKKRRKKKTHQGDSGY
ncbi:hypothetical protein JHK82_037482 [Glycine max]|nr:hypothetical protein JHK85_038231 [Glycine max]KAG5114213.1 hypothetical protein JHK82_037482 [Glycine max]